jgi:hypothetical protein
MSKITLGVSCGLAYGIIDVLLMIPLEMERKELAMLGAFINRFAIGFISPNLQIGFNRILTALLVAVLLSLSAAVVVGAWAPILGFGCVGGLVIGCIDQWVSNRQQKQVNRPS